MRIISRKILKEFYEKPEYSDSKGQLEAWFHSVKKATWDNPNDVKDQYRNSSLLRNNRVCFNIAGNKYRLIVKIEYRLKLIFIRFIGTHKQYDHVDANSI